VTGPETITREELEAVLTRCLRTVGKITFMGEPGRIAADLFTEAQRQREPEYESAAAYVDARGDIYLRSSTGGWVDYSTTWHPHAFPLRPLRRLVPDSPHPPRPDSEVIFAVIAEHLSRATAARVTGQIMGLLDGTPQQAGTEDR
jgi:hypothetical protein